MAILSGVGQKAADDLILQFPGIEEYLKAREDQLVATIQPMIDEVRSTVAAVGVDVDAVGKLVASVNVELVPEVVKLVKLLEGVVARLDAASRAFGAALAAR